MKIALSAKDKRARARSLEIICEIQHSLTAVKSCRINEDAFRQHAGHHRKAEKISRHAHTMDKIEKEARRLANMTRSIIWEGDKKKRLPKPKCRAKWHSYLLKHTKTEEAFIHEMAWLEGQKELLGMMYGGNTFIKLA